MEGVLDQPQVHTGPRDGVPLPGLGLAGSTVARLVLARIVESSMGPRGPLVSRVQGRAHISVLSLVRRGWVHYHGARGSATRGPSRVRKRAGPDGARAQRELLQRTVGSLRG